MTDSAPTRQLKGARTGAACDRVVRSLLAAVALATVLLPSATEAAPGTTARYVRKTSGPVLALAADGDRAAVVVAGKNLYPGSPFIGCSSVVVWEPVRSRSGVLESAARCARTSLQETIGVAIAGTRVAWLVKGGVNSVGTLIKTATLMRRTPVELAGGGALDGLAGTFVRPPVGDGTLLVFTHELRCHPDYENYACPPGRKANDVVDATIWRVAGRGSCPESPARGCLTVARANGDLRTLAVDAGRVAARTRTGVRILTSGGRALHEFAVEARGAALSGNRLAVRTTSAVEVYDARTGRRVFRIPAASGVRLQDLDGDLLVTASAGTVTLRRLSDGKAIAIRTGRVALAQLERPGLFVAGGRRVNFLPMRDVVRRLGR
jgi:hypothetical protein